MKSVGLITSWRENYGSVLQCYATKKYIKDLGFHCDLFYEDNKGIERYKHYLKRALFLASRSLRSKEFHYKYKAMKDNASHASSKIETVSWELIRDFAENKLQPRGVDYALLKRLAYSDEYIAFLAGSDQIWNAQEPMNPLCFLSFAPNHKKIALAPSFGTNDIAKFNKRDFKRNISSFAHLSVREDAGVEIVRQLVGETVERLHDPSILLTPEQWRCFADKGCKRERPYIMLHFLDEPSKSAVAFVEQIKHQTNYDVVIFAYDHQEFKKTDNVFFVNGTPEDYVSLIDNATYVCTDSFHTTLFSIYLDSAFYTFERLYKKTTSQSSRLHTLLKLYNYGERFIATDADVNFEQLLQLELHSCSEMLHEERCRIEHYLKETLNVQENVTHNTPDLKDRTDCTGCGACVAVCPKRAISYVNDPLYGYAVSVVNDAECVHCGLCENVCQKRLLRPTENQNEKKAYIAYNADPIMRMKSASGGVFSAIAQKFIEDGGVVFGAKLDFSSDLVSVHHSAAETIEELIPLLNSKYVQSQCSEVYPALKEYLNKGRKVLFSGTSCQVKALYNYLGKEYENLYTVDLICHGVPGESMFQAYIKYVEEKYHGKVADFSFRKKRENGSFYVMTVELEQGEKKKSIEIEMKQSSYYRMFMAEDIYREACYRCEYATIEKPADITLGDYYEANDDYPELFVGSVSSLKIEQGISCVITHNSVGEMLLQNSNQRLVIIPADLLKAQRSHSQLRKPSMFSLDRSRYFSMYRNGGYGKIERFISKRDKLKDGMKRMLGKNG